jgi:hypothetical protein
MPGSVPTAAITHRVSGSNVGFITDVSEVRLAVVP